MTAWIISSTVLMLMVLGLRTVLKGRISLGLQYALWLLVLVRLLLPVNFTQSALSILGAAERVMETPPMQTVTELADTRPEVRSYAEAYADVAARYEAQGTPLNTLSQQELREFDRQVQARQTADYTVGDAAVRILKAAWIVGMAVTALCLLGANLRFALRLRRSRRAVPVPGCALPVYVSGAVDTPCLFGLLKPGIYLPADIPWDERAMEHILTHEQTHYRHGDHIWSVLRCVCLAVHWYNPLVWICAGLSRRDGELACDEASIRALGEECRTEYGRTLIDMTCQKPRSMVGLTATTMNDSQKSLRERITLIAKHPKTAVYTLILVILVASLAVGCTFTGTPSETELSTEPTTESQQTEPPTQPATEWETAPPPQPPTDPPTVPPTDPSDERLAEYQALFDWNGDLMYNLAAGHPYSRPEDVDLTWLFYGGVDYPGSWNSISEADRNLLVREGFWTDLDIQIMPAAMLEEVLQKYFAVGLADVTIPEQWVYSSASDTYYSNHNDAYINTVTVMDYEKASDGTVNLRLLVDFVVDGKDWYSNTFTFMTLRPTEEGWQIISNRLYDIELGTAVLWRDPEEIQVYPFTDYAMETALRVVEEEVGIFASAEDVLTFQVENIGFDPMSTDQAVLAEMASGNPSGLSLDDLFARRICFAVTYSAAYGHGGVEHGQMLVTLARYVDTGVWYCTSSTIQPGSDYPARLLTEEELHTLDYLGEEIVAAYRAEDGKYDYWIFVKHPGTGRIICIRE